MDAIINLIAQSLGQVWITFTHNWYFLVISILIAVALKLYANPTKVSAFLMRYKRAGVVAATAAAVTTPLCSCGTTAVVLGMMASFMPWAPIVAFMVASPLTSPEELIYSAGLFGWPFAIAFFVASILLGLLGGAAASFFEARGWLKNQNRYSSSEPAKAPKKAQPAPAFFYSSEVEAAPVPARASAYAAASNQAVLVACGCDGSTTEMALDVNSFALAGGRFAAADDDSCGCGSPVIQPVSQSCGCGSSAPEPAVQACSCGAEEAQPERAKVTPRLFAAEVLSNGKRLLIMFFGFAFIGYVLNGLIPQEWVASIFGAGNVYSIPLAATLGVPLYINTEASLPLVRALIDGGMSQGAALAFLITGAGTSIGAMTGALTIARWRVIGLVIGTLWAGSIVIGYAYNILLAMKVF